MWCVDLGQPAGEFWRATPRRFRALTDRVMRLRAERLAVIAQSHGAKATADDFLPKREKGVGPEAFYEFRKAMGV